jgi:hypothetical protein
MLQLPEQQRILSVADVLINASDTQTMRRISLRRIRAGDQDNTVFSQMRNMVTGHWGPGFPRKATFPNALNLLVPQNFTNERQRHKQQE